MSVFNNVDIYSHNIKTNMTKNCMDEILSGVTAEDNEFLNDRKSSVEKSLSVHPALAL